MSQPLNQYLLAALMDTIPDRIYFKDRQGHFLSFSKAFLDFLNFTEPGQLRGKTDFDIFLPEHAQEAFDDEQEIIRTGRPIVGKIEKEVLPDGRIRWVSTTKVPLHDDSGAIIGTCGISRDITDEHAQAEKLREYTAALKENQNQMEQELILAREIQDALLPDEFPDFPRGAGREHSTLRFHFRYLPAGKVGGDFFNVQRLSDTQAGVLICDVMGHGVHAALITAIQRVLVDELAPWAHQPAAFLEHFNRHMCRLLQRVETRLFVTACYLTLDTATGLIRLANAGHPHPLLLSRSTHRVKRLHVPRHSSGLPLGVMEDSTYETFEDTLMPGDALLLFTDGLCDIFTGGNDFGEKDLQQLVRQAYSLSGEALLDEVIAQVRALCGAEHFKDDVCLLSVEWAQSAEI